MSDNLERNLGLAIVRATEAAALAAGRWMGLGDRASADHVAGEAMHAVLNRVDMDGLIVIGEDRRHEGVDLLIDNALLGNRNGPPMDVIVDAIEGVRLLAEGFHDAISVVALTPRGAMRSLRPAVYMKKLVISATPEGRIGPEVLNAPEPWTLGVVARALKKPVRDLTVFVLNRPRHQELIEHIRMAGARVLLREEADLLGAVLASTPNSGVDLMMGIGGTAEGVMGACAVKALGGTMYCQLAPQSQEEHDAVLAAGYDLKKIMSKDDLVSSNDIFFAATGITDSILLQGVRYHGSRVTTHSLVLRGKSDTRRQIYADYHVD